MVSRVRTRPPPHAAGSQWRERLPPDQRGIEYIENAVLLQQVQQRTWGIDGERLAFAQNQQPSQCVDVTANQDHTRDR